MLTVEQLAVVATTWVAIGASMAAYLAATDRGVARHSTNGGGRGVAGGPPTVPTLLGTLAGMPSTIGLPGPRRHSGKVPVLVVDGPPSTRGRLPAPDLPLERRPSCSLCSDGANRAFMARTPSGPACTWCGTQVRP